LQQESEQMNLANESIKSLSQELQELKSAKDTENATWETKWKLSEDQRELEKQERMELETKLEGYQCFDLLNITVSKKASAEMESRWQSALEDLSKNKRELASINSAQVLKLKELENKNQRLDQIHKTDHFRIKEQEKELEEVSAKLQTYHTQLDEALKSFEALDRAYKAQLAYYEEVEKISQQREMSNTRIVRPVEAQVSASST
jgi:hypothetical protein